MTLSLIPVGDCLHPFSDSEEEPSMIGDKSIFALHDGGGQS